MDYYSTCTFHPFLELELRIEGVTSLWNLHSQFQGAFMIPTCRFSQEYFNNTIKQQKIKQIRINTNEKFFFEIPFMNRDIYISVQRKFEW